ncbi:MAG: DUF1189 family protein [Patescibacteria group bacterium]
MEKKMNFFQKITKSFNPSFSKEVRGWKAKEGLKYLFLLAFLFALIISAKNSISFYFSTRNIPENAESFFLENFKDFPEIEVEEGKVSSTTDPFLKHWSYKKGTIAFAVDTGASEQDIVSGKYSSYNEGLFLLEDRLILRTVDANGKTSTDIYPLRDINLSVVFNPQKGEFLRINWEGQVFNVTPAKVSRWLTTFNLILFPFLFVFLIIFLFLAKLIQILIFSIVSLIINAIAKTGLSFKQLFNIGVFSLTLPFVLEEIVDLLSLNIPNFAKFNYVLYLGLLVAWIVQPKGKVEEKKAIVSTPDTKKLIS